MKTINKTIRFDTELIELIEKLAQQQNRDFSGMVRHIILEKLKSEKENENE